LRIFAGIKNGDWDRIKNGANTIGESFKGVGEEMKVEAKAAWQLQDTLNKLDDRETKLMRTISERRKAISQYILDSRDQTRSAEERLKAVEKANALESSIIKDEIALQKERVAVYEKQHAMANDLVEDEQALAAEQAKLNDLERQGNNRLRELVNRRNELKNAIERETVAIQKNNAAKNKPVAALEDAQTRGLKKGYADVYGRLPKELKEVNTEVKGISNEIQTTFIELDGIVHSTMTSMVEGFATGIGQLIAGTANISVFASLMLVPLADMAIQVGKIAIQTGIAMLGIKKAFNNPFTAIAAGIALVALGTAVKSSLQSAVSGGSGSFSQAAPRGTIDTRTSAVQTQPIEIELSGTFVQRGSDLVATVNKENARRKLTT